MGLFGTSDPLKKEEKHLTKEGKAEEKEQKHLEKALHDAEKNLDHAIKKEKDAVSHHEKAQKNEGKLAHKLSEAQAKHDKSVTDIHQAEQVVQSRTQAHQTAEQKLEQVKAQLDNFSHQHAEHETARKTRLEEIHRVPEESARAAANAGVPATATGAAAGTGAVAANRDHGASGIGHSGVQNETAQTGQYDAPAGGVPTGATGATGTHGTGLPEQTGVTGQQQGFVPQGGMPQDGFAAAHNAQPR